MKININIKNENNVKSQVLLVSQLFESDLIQILNSTTGLGEDFALADRTESTEDGELVVKFALSLADDKIEELNDFTKRLYMAFSEVFLLDFVQSAKLALEKDI